MPLGMLSELKPTAHCKSNGFLQPHHHSILQEQQTPTHVIIKKFYEMEDAILTHCKLWFAPVGRKIDAFGYN